MKTTIDVSTNRLNIIGTDFLAVFESFVPIIFSKRIGREMVG